MSTSSGNEGSARCNLNVSLETLVDYESISFDFFDTLVYRESISHFRGWKQISLQFALNRALAEILARIISRFRGNPEVRSEEIYKFILKFWNFGMEIENERRILKPNLYLQKIFNQLATDGHDVFVISDTHFTAEIIGDWMVNLGFHPVKIYTSQQFLKTKSTGLFQEIHVQNQYSYYRWVHVGDNLHSDIRASSKLGITPSHQPKLILQLEEIGVLSLSARKYLIKKGSLGVGVLNNLIDSLAFNGVNRNTAQQNSLQNLGKFVVSPIGKAIAKSVHSVYEGTGSDLILYCSRDGWIPSLFHSKMFPNDHIRYFKTSRKMLTEIGYDAYVRNEIGASKNVCIYDLGWRGTTLSWLQAHQQEISWHGIFAFINNRDVKSAYKIFGGSRREALAIWRSRDFVETLFSDLSNGFSKLDENLQPIERSDHSEGAPIEYIWQGLASQAISSERVLTPEEAALLLFVTCRYPSKILKHSLRNTTHDIKVGFFQPLITDSWKSLLSSGRVMWPYASTLRGEASWFEYMTFKRLLFIKESFQRSLNLIGRVRSK